MHPRTRPPSVCRLPARAPRRPRAAACRVIFRWRARARSRSPRPGSAARPPALPACPPAAPNPTPVPTRSSSRPDPVQPFKQDSVRAAPWTSPPSPNRRPTHTAVPPAPQRSRNGCECCPSSLVPGRLSVGLGRSGTARHGQHTAGRPAGRLAASEGVAVGRSHLVPHAGTRLVRAAFLRGRAAAAPAGPAAAGQAGSTSCTPRGADRPPFLRQHQHPPSPPVGLVQHTPQHPADDPPPPSAFNAVARSSAPSCALPCRLPAAALRRRRRCRPPACLPTDRPSERSPKERGVLTLPSLPLRSLPAY